MRRTFPGPGGGFAGHGQIFPNVNAGGRRRATSGAIIRTITIDDTASSPRMRGVIFGLREDGLSRVGPTRGPSPSCSHAWSGPRVGGGKRRRRSISASFRWRILYLVSCRQLGWTTHVRTLSFSPPLPDPLSYPPDPLDVMWYQPTP